MRRVTDSLCAAMPNVSVFYLAALALLAGPATAQGSNVKPAQAQAWIDLATFSGMGMPGMGGGGNPMAMMGSMLGGGGGAGAKNSFGNTQGGMAGRWVDVTLYTRNNPTLAEAQQAVPGGFMSPALKLRAPQDQPAVREADDDKTTEPSYERPKGRLLLYWGCGDTVRPGQPKVLDMASASAADLAAFFVTRGAKQRGAHAAAGRPVWPNPADARMVPDGASLAGEHAFSGAGVPEAFRFTIPAAHDLMPPLQVHTVEQGGATALQWNALPTARAYFAAGMGAGERDEMVLWSSSEVPDTGFGLMDYQSNGAIDRWLRDKVLLAPATTRCSVPKGVFPDEGAMLRVIAYGNELNLAHPPRPADPKAAWAPVWTVKLRLKSMATVVPGMPAMGAPGAASPAQTGAGQPPAQGAEPAGGLPKPMDLLKGIFGG
jgi:hypothetical protein